MIPMRIISVLRRVAMVGVLLGASGCSMLFAGGSVGTDNPSVTMTFASGDSLNWTGTEGAVAVTIWKAGQNTLLDSMPVFDTVVTQGNGLRINAKSLGLADTAFAVEAIAGNGSVAYASHVAVADSDTTIQLQFTAAGSIVVLAASVSTVIDSLDTSDATPKMSDTLYASGGAISFTPSAITGNTNTIPAFLVFLGTSVVIPSSEMNSSGVALSLPPGTYSVLVVDSLYAELSRISVKIE